jgi:tartrate dehydratase alpha subunit/fumarate hydratase class I-like protein
MENKISKLAIMAAITLALAGTALAAVGKDSGSRAHSLIPLADTSMSEAMSVDIGTSHLTTHTFNLDPVVVYAARHTSGPVATTTVCSAWRKGRITGGWVRSCE